MGVVKLTLDDFFEDEQFTVIAIHCVIEQYRLAYLINKHLNISLKRTNKDVVQEELNTCYDLFEFSDSAKDVTFNLVGNSCKVKIEKATNAISNLFSQETNTNEVFSYLIPELKKVAYFLKIDTEFGSAKKQLTINKILEIPQVITAYNVDSTTLKSKNNLIFN